ncbi:heparinase II/III family protein [Bacillus aquiflavi]|uniref:heparinase II/III domain-containing protein n=1 Tax=Bacillus aquiflavi TaxID=2672567 RepID=UPI001CA9AEB6|nr:heparinase II/III family protein [Bacillus aquiflavi]UAC49110.1 heparinase II/III family protein [Bacillus aquiflavi]
MTIQVLNEKDLPDVHSEISNRKRLEEIFTDYKNKIYLVSGRYSKVKLADHELWTTKVHDRSWLFWHHCLVSVPFLIDSYYVDRNDEKINLAYEIIEKWFQANHPISPSEMGWHDHSTALRLLHIVKLYLVFHEKKNSKVLNRLSKISEYHMKKLADPNFYQEKHNHGLDQDIALFISAHVLTKLQKSNEWKNLALKRFWRQVHSIFASDGSYLEHSPQYIYLMLERLLNFYRILYQTNQAESTILLTKIEKIFTFYLTMLHPNGQFPTIGDSEAETAKKIAEKYLNLLPKKLSANIVSFQKGMTNMPLDAFYRNGGYAFFRSDWKNDEETTQIIFYSAFHSRVHKHHDDLSFTLYGHGMPLLIDAGKFTYEYDRPERKYVVSAYGHNTVRLNKRETDLKRQHINQSGILSFLATKNIGYASGFHTLTKGVTHRRMLFFLKPYDLLVIDLIRGNQQTTGELILNLHHQLKVHKKNEKVIALKGTKPLLSITQLGGGTFNIQRGKKNPLLGWSSPTYGEFFDNHLLTLERKGKEIKFVTHISLKNENTIKDFKWNLNQIRFSWKGFKVFCKLTDYYEHLFFNGKHYDTKKNYNNKTLLESLTKNNIEFVKSFYKPF